MGVNLGHAMVPVSDVAPHWYVACTMSRHEKQVAGQLEARRIEYFLPLYQCVHRWKDRRVRLDLPLFPGYVFVRMKLPERLSVLSLSGISSLVAFGGQPVYMQDEEITGLREGLARVHAEPHPYLKVGQRVLIKHGPFSGQVGILSRKKDHTRVVLSLDLVMRSIAIEIDAADLAALN